MIDAWDSHDSGMDSNAKMFSEVSGERLVMNPLPHHHQRQFSKQTLVGSHN
jgi:hypothetical protein